MISRDKVLSEVLSTLEPCKVDDMPSVGVFISRMDLIGPSDL